MRKITDKYHLFILRTDVLKDDENENKKDLKRHPPKLDIRKDKTFAQSNQPVYRQSFRTFVLF